MDVEARTQAGTPAPGVTCMELAGTGLLSGVDTVAFCYGALPTSP
jgi:hypothetical protein